MRETRRKVSAVERHVATFLLATLTVWNFLLSDVSATSTHTLIGENKWCAPINGIVDSTTRTTTPFTPEQCKSFCLATPTARSFIVRQKIFENGGSPIYQCLCHSGTCVADKLLNEQDANVYQIDDRVGSCVAGYTSIMLQESPYTMICAQDAVLHECFDDECPVDVCCHELTGCASRTSCAFVVESNVNCVRKCEDVYLEFCQCAGGASCTWFAEERRFACQGDCPIPSGADLTSRNIEQVNCPSEFASNGAIPRLQSCPITCAENHIFLGDGSVTCSKFGELSYDVCFRPCTVALPTGATSSCTQGSTVLHGESCVIECSESGVSPSGDGVLYCVDGVMDSDETCVEDPCSNVQAHIEGLANIRQYAMPEADFGLEIHAQRCSRYVGTSAETFASGSECYLECSSQYLATVPYNDDTRVLKLACSKGSLDVAASCAPPPCDMTAFFVYNMDKLVCGDSEVDRFGSVLQGSGSAGHSDECALVCANGFVPSGDGILQCGDSVLGYIQGEYCRRYSPSAECEVDATGVKIGSNTFEGGVGQGSDACGDRCYAESGCRSFRMGNVANGDGKYECELWTSICPQGTESSAIDYTMSVEGSCSVAGIEQAVQGMEAHTCVGQTMFDQTSCSFTCEQGYTVSGEGTLSCSNGVVSVNDGCDANGCARPSIDHLASLNCVDSSGQNVATATVPPGSSCSMICASGYAPSGSGSLSCMAGSMPSQNCESWCDVSSLSIENTESLGCTAADGSRAQLLRHGETCSYECAFGFTAHGGDNELTCTLQVLETGTCVPRAAFAQQALSASTDFARANITVASAEMHIVGVLTLSASGSHTLPRGCESFTFEQSSKFMQALSNSNYASGYALENPYILSCVEIASVSEDVEITVGFSYRSRHTSDSDENIGVISPAKQLLQVYAGIVDSFALRLSNSDEDLSSFIGSTVTFAVKDMWIEDMILIKVPSTNATRLSVLQNLISTVSQGVEAPTNIPQIATFDDVWSQTANDEYLLSWSAHKFSDASVPSAKMILRIELVFSDATSSIPSELQLYGVGFDANDVVYLNQYACSSTNFVSDTVVVCSGIPNAIAQRAQVSLNQNVRGPIVAIGTPTVVSSTRISTSGGDVTLRGTAFGNDGSSLRLRARIPADLRNANPNICTPIASAFDKSDCVVEFSNGDLGVAGVLPLVRDSASRVSFSLSGKFVGHFATFELLVDMSPALASSSTLRTEHPRVSSVSPVDGYGGTVLTITGENFGHTAPDACESFDIKVGSYACATDLVDETGVAIGWKSDTNITCLLSEGRTGSFGAISVTRAAQSNLDSDILFEYLGNTAPMNPDEIAAMVWEEGTVTMNIECPGQGQGPVDGQDESIVYNQQDYASVDDLSALVDTEISSWTAGCSSRPTYVIISSTTRFPTIEALVVLDGAEGVCSGTEASPPALTDCNTMGSSGALAIGVIGSNFNELEIDGGGSRIADVLIDDSSVYFEVRNDSFLECILPVGIGKSNVLSVIDLAGSSNDTAFIRYTSPQISSVTGCPEIDSIDGRTVTFDCPRQADSDVYLTIEGTDFGSRITDANFAPNIFLGKKRCENAIFMSENSLTGLERLRCDLPSAGPGNLQWQAIFLLVQDVFSTPLDFVRYDPCLEGEYYNEANETCSFCEPGTYAPSRGLAECLECRIGTYASEAGSSECLECEAGTYAPTAESSTCKSCIPGSYQSSPGKSECNLCMTGRYSADEEAQMCSRCEAGKAQSLQGQPSCITCADGYFTEETASEVCQICDLGFACLDGHREECPCRTSDCLFPETGYDCSSEGSYSLETRCPFKNKCARSSDKPVPCRQNELCPVGTSGKPRFCFDSNAYAKSSIGEIDSNNTSVESGNGTSASSAVDDVFDYCACREGYFGVYGEVSDTIIPAYGQMKELATTFCESLRIYDADNSSTISLNELQYMLEHSWALGDIDAAPLSDYDHFTTNIMPREFNAADIDVDSVIQFEEFCEYYEELRKTRILLHCFLCPEGAVCDEDDVDIFNIKIASGYWQSQDFFFDENNLQEEYGKKLIFRPCDTGTIGGCKEVSSVWSQCSEGNADAMCAKCVEGGGKFSPAFGMIPETGLCEPCRSDGSEIAIAIIFYGGLFVLFMLWKYYSHDIFVFVAHHLNKHISTAYYGNKNDAASEIALTELGNRSNVKDASLEGATPSHNLRGEEDESETGETPSHALSDDDGATKSAGRRTNDDTDDDDDDDDQGGGGRDDVLNTKRPSRDIPKPPSSNISTDRPLMSSNADVEKLDIATFTDKNEFALDTNMLVKFKSLIGVTQIIFSLRITVDVNWPNNPLMDVFSFVTLSPWELPLTQCAWRVTFYEKFWFMMIAPIVVVCFLWPVIYQVYKYLPRERFGVMSIESLYQMSFFLPFLIYPLNCNFISAMINCETLEDGISYLKADYEQVCFEGEHMNNFIFAVPFMILYPIGVPAYFAYSIYSNRKVLYDPTGHRDTTGRPNVPLPATERKMGFLYASYRPHAAWFEIAELFRKFFFTILFLFISPTYPAQLVLGIVFCVTFTSFAAWIAPFADPVDQFNFLLTDLSLLMVVVGGLALYVINASYDDETLAPSIDDFLVLCTAVPFCIVVANVFLQTGFMDHLIKDIKVRIQEYKFGLYGPSESLWRIVADRSCGFCCRTCIKRRPKVHVPILTTSVTRPIHKMNETISKLLKSEEKLNLLCRLSSPVRQLCEMAHANGDVLWQVEIDPVLAKELGYKVGGFGKKKILDDDDDDEDDGSASSKVADASMIADKSGRAQAGKSQKWHFDSNELREHMTDLLSNLNRYMSSMDHSMNAEGSLTAFNRARQCVRTIYIALRVCSKLRNENSTRRLSICLEEDVEEVNTRAVYEVYQRLKQSVSMLKHLRAYKIAMRSYVPSETNTNAQRLPSHEHSAIN